MQNLALVFYQILCYKSCSIMENNIDIVVDTTEALKASSKGRYLENIAKICQTKHGWSEDTTKAILDEAIKQSRIQTTTVNNKVSYRKFENKKVCIEDDCETNATQTDPLPLNDFVTKDQLDRFQSDFVEFKRFSHGEILSLKADIASRSPNPKVNTQCDRDREALVTCLQQRIISLERQLQDKQIIIEKLLDGHKPAVPSFRQATPTGIEEKVTQCNKTNGEQSMKQTVDTTKTKDTKKTIQNDQSGEQNQEQRSKQTTMKGTEIQSKQTREQNQENGPKQAKTKSRKRITIVGDSMLNGILDEGLQKDHNVQVKRHPGATTRDIVDYVRPVIRKKPDCIIIHAGTNDLTSQEKPDTVSNFRKIIEEAKLESPDTSIVLSTAVMRKDKQAIDKKVSMPALNREIREFANAMKISVVDNSNLDVSCLSRKKLHLNEKGNAYLARNFLNFIKTF